MTALEELERQELEAKYSRMTEEEQREEARRLQEYTRYHQRRTGSIRVGM